jgi:asparagine synthase (glutamine-hydrolysing)
MYPFLSILWDQNDAEAAAVAAQLLNRIHISLPNYAFAFNEAGCVLLHRPPSDGVMRIYRLAYGAGVILGRVFPTAMDKWTEEWSWSPSPAEALEIIRTHGQWLIQQMWGGYVAFLRDPAGNEVSVIRDCSGGLPCYRLRHLDVDLLFADPAVLCVLGLVPDSLNWDYLVGFVCSSQLEIRDTALEGVTELLAGDCFRRTSGSKQTHYCAWTPADVLRRPLVNRFDSAVEDVRRVAQSCISAWASVFDVIVHTLSGGLDSSVVLACLAEHRARATVVCVNKYGMQRSEDERAFARLVAAKTKVQLLEIPIRADEHRIDDTLTQVPLTAKPTVSGTIGSFEISLLDEVTSKFKASRVWTGQGGDHLFLQMSLPLGPVDYAALLGFRLGLLRTLRDAVHISKWNYWRTTRLLWDKDFDLAALALGGTPIAKHPFIVAGVHSRVSPQRLMHPWMACTETLPVGQRVQIAALSEVLNRHRPLPGRERTQEHHPLLSQPLLELCLRIPSYVHLHGGVDRAVERAAFSDLLPPEIVARREKGVGTFSVLEILNRSNNYLRGLLLDGVLVKQGILDRSSLEPFLTGRRLIDRLSFWPLLSVIAAELWVQNWRNCFEKTENSVASIRRGS